MKEFPCSELKEMKKGYSCPDLCGRLLNCENHYCTKKCHNVKGKPEAGKVRQTLSSRVCVEVFVGAVIHKS